MSDISNNRTVAAGNGGVAEAVLAVFRGVRDALQGVETAIRRSWAFDELNAMSDAALDRRGLSRGQIARHVFDTVR